MKADITRHYHNVWLVIKITFITLAATLAMFCLALIFIGDTEPPKIEAPSSVVGYVGDKPAYKKFITVSDNDGSDPKIEVDARKVNTKKAGTYYVNYTVTDKAGNVLTEKNGAYTGMVALDPDKPVNENVIVYTDKFAISIAVNAYTLIIDEASDMDYFQVKQNLVGTRYSFAEGDFEWGGYYLMVKDIDMAYKPHTLYASNVTFNGNNAPSTMSSLGYEIITTGLASNKGLTGTFNGNGHTINNIVVAGNGLFGVINGGVLKNVGLYVAPQTRYCLTCGIYGQSTSVTTCSGGCGVKPTATNIVNGAICTYVINGAKLSDIYFESNYGLGSKNDVLLFTQASTDSTFTRFVIDHKDQQNLPNSGSDGPLVLVPSALTQFTDSYFINSRGVALHGDCESRTFQQNTTETCSDCSGAGVDCAACEGKGYIVTASTDVTYTNGVIIHTDAKVIDGVTNGRVRENNLENKYSTGVYWGCLGSTNYQKELSKDFTLNGAETYEIVVVEGFRRYSSQQYFYWDRRNYDYTPFENKNPAWDTPNVWKIADGVDGTKTIKI